MKGIFFWCFLLLGLESKGQFLNEINASLNKGPIPEIKFDSRNSFIGARYARIYGIKIGLDYDGVFKFGLGFNWLASDIYRDMNIVNSRGLEEKVKAQYKLDYFSPYAEYAFFKKDPWDISVSVLLGFGRAKYAYFDSYWSHNTTNSNFVFIYEPYMTARYRFIKYASAGAGVGYRLAVSGDKFSTRRLNSPIYVIKFKIFFGELYKDFI